METDEDEGRPTIDISVVIALSIEYPGQARHFNEDDVLALTLEGVESHYRVVDSSVSSFVEDIGGD